MAASMDVDPDRVALERVKGLCQWFDDGSVVGKAPRSLYRVTVSRGVLVLQAPIFADMFSIPQPHDAETVDGWLPGRRYARRGCGRRL